MNDFDVESLGMSLSHADITKSQENPFHYVLAKKALRKNILREPSLTKKLEVLK